MQAFGLKAFVLPAAALALSACAGASLPSSTSPTTASIPGPVPAVAQRELGPDEKRAIMAAVSPSLRNAAAAKYHWTRLAGSASDDSLNYCATVDAQSPYAAYSGHQAYIVEVKLAAGKVTSAILGLVAGGKDVALVSKMCAKYGLDPNKG